MDVDCIYEFMHGKKNIFHMISSFSHPPHKVSELRKYELIEAHVRVYAIRHERDSYWTGKPEDNMVSTIGVDGIDR